jgi:hypothetical protein
MWLVPCFLRAAYTTALHPFAMRGPRTKVLSPTGSSSRFTSVSVHSVFEMFHCSRETASCKHNIKITAKLQFNNNLQYISFQNVLCYLVSHWTWCSFIGYTNLLVFSKLHHRDTMYIRNNLLTNQLTHSLNEAESLRSHQSLSYSRLSQHFMELKGSLLCSQQPTTSL